VPAEAKNPTKVPNSRNRVQLRPQDFAAKLQSRIAALTAPGSISLHTGLLNLTGLPEPYLNAASLLHISGFTASGEGLVGLDQLSAGQRKDTQSFHTAVLDEVFDHGHRPGEPEPGVIGRFKNANRGIAPEDARQVAIEIGQR
jgi:hypothetical protein